MFDYVIQSKIQDKLL